MRVATNQKQRETPKRGKAQLEKARSGSPRRLSWRSASPEQRGLQGTYQWLVAAFGLPGAERA